MIILTIAGATCKEAIRTRSFVFLLVIYTIAVCMSRVVGWISGTDGHVIATDLVFSFQNILGVLVAVATGTALVQAEIQQRTLYTVLSRPLARWQFVVGKFLGLCSALIVGQIAMILIVLSYLYIIGAPVTWHLVWAGFFTAELVCIMAAVSLMWTSVSSPLLAAVLSLITYACGNAVHDLPQYINYIPEDWQRTLAVCLASLVPDLGAFNYRNEAVYGVPMSDAEWRAIPYGLVWIVLLVVITVSTIRRKQL